MSSTRDTKPKKAAATKPAKKAAAKRPKPGTWEAVLHSAEYAKKHPREFSGW